MNFDSKGAFAGSKPIIISGPCSAESRSQVLETAKQLHGIDYVNIFRAGIWKPRTRPNSFEGVGAVGLAWLKEAGTQYGMPVTTEVANAKHVELCLAAGIDILWIGARTTVNPFAVQEIADALRGVNIPVMVKNPINPDLNLWMGAIERIYNSGIRELAAIHRGFSSATKSKYRNKPLWEIPIQLKTEFPDLSIFCDPSHIGGSRDLIQPLSQRAFDLDFDGLMIESHISPADALSDAKQQVTPDALHSILAKLQIKNKTISDSQFNQKLETLRSDIDELDEELLRILGKRMEMVEAIGHYKKQYNITPFQLQRWREILESRKMIGSELNLSEKFIQDFLGALHTESLEKQTKIVKVTPSPKTDQSITW